MAAASDVRVCRPNPSSRRGGRPQQGAFSVLPDGAFLSSRRGAGGRSEHLCFNQVLVACASGVIRAHKPPRLPFAASLDPWI